VADRVTFTHICCKCLHSGRFYTCRKCRHGYCLSCKLPPKRRRPRQDEVDNLRGIIRRMNELSQRLPGERARPTLAEFRAKVKAARDKERK